ncbi:hypothetical protein QKU58_gp115 [Pyramimonas orientalis virus]|uniref:SAP domain-containing protein n=1 Tax=Pyramimonas orientalis virus 01B TaxID=3134525 RepID=A0A7M3UNG3_9VIRU|nr:hypothetical protein QKU58_gp115 [Pyramimonas orientalis virus]QOI90216.1 hypothetical protein HWQ62_00079 [Pyramimonas orientalis virus]
MTKSIKSNNSLQNIILLLLFVIGLFVLYRYVKTVENETKLLHNHVIELTEKVQQMSTKARSTSSKKHLPNRPSEQQETQEAKDFGGVEVSNDSMEMSGILVEGNNDDTASIQSEDITNMLRRVMGGDDNEQEDAIINEIVVEVRNDSCERESCVKIEEIEEVEEVEEVEDDEISFTQKEKVSPPPIDTKSTLLKKTNEELKNMLKTASLSTKGSKSELVERLISNM